MARDAMASANVPGGGTGARSGRAARVRRHEPLALVASESCSSKVPASSLPDVATSTIDVAGQRVRAEVYDGRYLPPTLRVRPGDVIDYAYSVNGDNPVLAGRFADLFSLSHSDTVALVRARLLWPAGRRLFVRPQQTDLQPTVTQGPDEVEYVWERRNAPGVEPPLWSSAAMKPGLADICLSISALAMIILLRAGVSPSSATGRVTRLRWSASGRGT